MPCLVRGVVGQWVIIRRYDLCPTLTSPARYMTRSTQSAWMLSIRRLAKPLSRWTMSSQQPGTGRVNAKPHSSPGRLNLDSLCALGPQEGSSSVASGPTTVAADGPVPVSETTSLISVPIGHGGAFHRSAHASRSCPCNGPRPARRVARIATVLSHLQGRPWPRRAGPGRRSDRRRRPRRRSSAPSRHPSRGRSVQGAPRFLVLLIGALALPTVSPRRVPLSEVLCVVIVEKPAYATVSRQSLTAADSRAALRRSRPARSRGPARVPPPTGGVGG